MKVQGRVSSYNHTSGYLTVGEHGKTWDVKMTKERFYELYDELADWLNWKDAKLPVECTRQKSGWWNSDEAKRARVINDRRLARKALAKTRELIGLADERLECAIPRNIEADVSTARAWLVCWCEEQKLAQRRVE